VAGHLNKTLERIRSPYCQTRFGKVRDFPGWTGFDYSLSYKLNLWKYDGLSILSHPSSWLSWCLAVSGCTWESVDLHWKMQRSLKVV